MKRSVRQILDFLGGTREARIGSIQVFPAVDVDQLANELRLEEKGGEAGRANQPSSDDESPDSNEREILYHIERYSRKAREEYLEARSIQEGRVRRGAITGAQQVAVEAAGQNAIADLKAAILNDRNQLHLLKHEVTERGHEFRTFRNKHHLDRPPRLHSPRGQLFLALLLVLFLLLESILNGTFFAKGSEGGLVGGVLQAFVLSLLNVGVGFGYAWILLPRLFDRRVQVKIVGAALAIGFVAWVFILNFTIGHIRDLYIGAQGSVATKAVFDRLTTRPFLLDDANSLILTLLGIGLALLSVLDGIWFGDPYPGYAAVGRDRQKAIASYADGKKNCLIKLTERRDQAVEEMTDALDQIRDSQYDVQLAVEGRSNLHQVYMAYLDDLAHAHEQLVRRYREFNQRARTTPPPGFFKTPVPRPAYLSPFPLDKLPDLGEGERRDLTNRIEQHIRAINQKVEEALTEYSTVDQLTDEETHAFA